MNLGDYLQAAARQAFVWGSHDCCTFPADWACAQLVADPMAHWRGAYASEEEAVALIEEAGSLTNLWAQGLDPLCASTFEYHAGDIGVALVIGEHGLVENGGIFTGKRWAFLAPRGLFVSSIDALCIKRAWRVPHV